MVSDVNEEALTAEASGRTPEDLVEWLAVSKAVAVAARCSEDALVLGCDSMLLFEGELYGKPADEQVARQRWLQLRGREGTLLTGHCLIDNATGKQAAGVAATTVRFGDPSDTEIDAYVDTGEPLGVAGGFTLDGRSAPFLRGVDGDPGNVIGLSLPLLRTLLGRLGVGVTQLWR